MKPLALVLLSVSFASLSLVIAGNWKAKQPPAPQRPAQEIKLPALAPGHVKIFNATKKDLGFMAYQKNMGVVCPKLPPSFGVTCIEVAAGKDVDLVLQPLAPELRR